MEAGKRLVEFTAESCDDEGMIPETAALQGSDVSAKTVHYGSHLFQISGYSLHREGLGPGDCVRASSAVFAVGGYDWQIYFFPGGVLDCFSDHVAAYLVLKTKDDEDIRVTASFQLRLVDVTGGSTPPYTITGIQKFGSGSDCAYGDHSFLKRSDLEGSPYLHDDRLTIECDIAINAKDAKSLPVVPPSDIVEHLGGRSKSSLHFGGRPKSLFHIGGLAAQIALVCCFVYVCLA